MSTQGATPDSAFLPSIASILARLQRTSEARGNHMLAYLIDLARAEAEEQMRCDLQDAMFRSEVLTTSSAHTWRAGAAVPGRPDHELFFPDPGDFDFAEADTMASDDAQPGRGEADPAPAKAA